MVKGCFVFASQFLSSPPLRVGERLLAVLADRGGWNGQWTNEFPAAQEPSVCGCNACPLP